MYLVMEFAEGQSLRAVQGDKPMEVGRALDIATPDRQRPRLPAFARASFTAISSRTT